MRSNVIEIHVEKGKKCPYCDYIFKGFLNAMKHVTKKHTKRKIVKD